MSDLHVTHHLAGGKLGPKLGPFPVAVWVLIVGAGLYIAHRRAQTAAATDTTTTDTTSTDTTTDTSSDVPFGVSSGVPAVYPISSSGGSSSDASTSSAPADNLAWASLAISALVKAGVTPITANNAIDRYLSGDVVSNDEATAVNRALTLVGPPPEGAPPVRVLPATTPPAPAPGAVPRPGTTTPGAKSKTAKATNTAPRPSRGGRVTVHAGDTLYGIAGSHHVAESQLYAKNRATIESAAKRHGRSSSESGHWIYPGTVLVLP